MHFMTEQLNDHFFSHFSAGKAFVPKQKPMDMRHEDVTTLDPELEEALCSATDTELCDLAGEKTAPRFTERDHC